MTANVLNGKPTPLVFCTHYLNKAACHHHSCVEAQQTDTFANAQNARIAQACPTPGIYPRLTLSLSSREQSPSWYIWASTAFL